MFVGIGMSLVSGRATSLLALYAVLGIRPKLVFDFANEKYFTRGAADTFDEAISYTGASNKTMVDSDGVLKWAPHNLLTYSEDFSNAAWVSFNTTETVNSIALTSTVGAVYRTLALPVLVSHTLSVDIKPGTNDFAFLSFSGGSGVYASAVFDVKNGAVGETRVSGAGYQIISSTIQSSDDHYTCTIKAIYGASAPSPVQVIGFAPAATGNTWDAFGNPTGNTSGRTLFVKNAHLYRSDLGGMVDNPDRGDSYVPTTTAARYLPRRGHHVYNGSAWVNEGLLVESEARTNRITYSEDFTQAIYANVGLTISVGSSLAPTGANMTRLTPTTASEVHRFRISSLGTAVMTASLYAKAAGYRYLVLGRSSATRNALFDLQEGVVLSAPSDVLGDATASELSATIEDVGNGVYKITYTQGQASVIEIAVNNTAVASSETFAGDGTSGIEIWGFQEEAASTPSSYIPTSGTTVTRAAETLTVAAADLPYPTPRVIGPELVTNGDFDSGTTGWVNFGSGSFTVSGGIATFTRTAFTDNVYQAITCVVGKVYEITYVVTAASATARLGFNSTGVVGGGQNDQILASAPGTYKTYIRASATTMYAVFDTAPDGATVSLDSVSVREVDPLSVSIQMQGRMTYADEGALPQHEYVRWYADASNYIRWMFDTQTGTGGPLIRQASGGVIDAVVQYSAYSPGINVPFNIASRHGSTFINGAVDGTALTADTTPVALPDLSATNLSLAFDYMGTVKLFRMWDQDLGDTGIAAASATWLLEDGYWEDTGQWVDTAKWNDGV